MLYAFLALSPILLALGNMICINNVVSVSATTGAAGEEGRIISVNLVPVAVYVALVLAVALVVIY